MTVVPAAIKLFLAVKDAAVGAEFVPVICINPMPGSVVSNSINKASTSALLNPPDVGTLEK